MLQFVNRFVILTLRGQRDGVPFQQVRLLRRRPQSTLEIGAGSCRVAALHFGHSGEEVSIRSSARVLVQFNFGQLYLIDAVTLEDPAAQSYPIRFVLFWSARNGHLQLVVPGVRCGWVRIPMAEVLYSRRVRFAEWILTGGPFPGSILVTRVFEIVYFVLPTQYSTCPSFSVALATTMYMPFFR